MPRGWLGARTLLLGTGAIGLALGTAPAVAQEDADCLACHAPFQGPDERCAKCHEVEAIESPGRPRFHGALLERECSACHTDHEGRAAPRAIREFRHERLVLADGTKIGGGPVASVVAGASELVIGVCTAGS